jgi:hypothetical protein
MECMEQGVSADCKSAAPRGMVGSIPTHSTKFMGVGGKDLARYRVLVSGRRMREVRLLF